MHKINNHVQVRRACNILPTLGMQIDDLDK